MRTSKSALRGLGRVVVAVLAAILLLPVTAGTVFAGCEERRIFAGMTNSLREAWSKVRDGADGSLGDNRTAFVSVAPQRYTFNALWAGMVGEPDVDRSLRIAEYGFVHRIPMGGFEYKLGKSPIGAAGDAAFFLASVGHSLMFLREETGNSAVAKHASRIQKLEEQVSGSIDWLARQSQYLAKDRKAANRVFVYANALILGGAIASDRKALSSGLEFLNSALSMQEPDGTFLENGGFDAAYQSVGLLHATSLLCHLPTDLVGERTRLLTAVERGAKRMLVAIEPTGFISQAGSTRVRADGSGEAINGKAKSLDPRYAAVSLHYAGASLSDVRFTDAAMRVAGYYYKPKR